MLTCRRGSSMAEAAITMPVVLLVIMYGINVSLVSHTALVAANAASYGARVGAVSQKDARFWAEAAARTALGANRTGGEFDAPSARVDENPGGVVTVTIHWRYPSIFYGLCDLVGGGDNCPRMFEGDAVSVWKKEGW
ncbi:MAG: TadE/TadG family type IV pilus assembly protein [Anaerolineales bacterium]